MESSSNEDALARRRAQNRLAQRRFRWKQSQQQQQPQPTQPPQPPKQPPVEIQPKSKPRPPADRASSAPTWRQDDAPPQRERERELGDVPSPGGLLSSFLDNTTINSPPAQSPVPKCRFSLLGNAALLASTSWVDDNGMDIFADLSEDPLHLPDLSDRVEPSSADRPAGVASRPAGLSSSSSTDILLNWAPGEPMPPHEPRLNPTDVPWPLHRPPEAEHSVPWEKTAARARGPAQIINPASSAASASSVEDGGAGARGDSWQGPLHIAAHKGNDQIVRLLLQHIADCNERDSDGLTPLFYAIQGGFEGIAASLLDSGARIDLVDKHQRNALHLAVVERRAGLLRLLLDRSGGDQGLIDSYDVAGMTPLHTAIDLGFEAGVQLLLQYGASLNYRARKN